MNGTRYGTGSKLAGIHSESNGLASIFEVFVKNAKTEE